MKRDRAWWEPRVHLSGEQLGKLENTDGGSARKWIRAAKRDPELCGLWGIDLTADAPEEDEDLNALGLLSPPPVGPAVLLYDIETAPGLAWVWGAYEQNAIAFEQDWYMLSFAYKWSNTDDIGFVSIFQDPKFYPDTVDDEYVAIRLAALFDAADAVVAHNGDKFDRKKANQRFLKWGIQPPSPYQAIDTLKITKTNFSHFSNALKELGRVHELGDKEHHTGFELWRECMRGNPEFWETMERYNVQDVALLEKVYELVLPWMNGPGKQTKINHGLWYRGTMVCPTCGHDRLTRKGHHRTAVSSFQTYRCDRCGAISRDRKADDCEPKPQLV